MIPQPPQIQLCSGNLDRHGVYLMDACTYMYLWVGAAVSDQFCRDVLEVPNFAAIHDGAVSIVVIRPHILKMIFVSLSSLTVFLNLLQVFQSNKHRVFQIYPNFSFFLRALLYKMVKILTSTSHIYLTMTTF